MAMPSMVKCTTVLARPVPLSASLEVMWSVADEPVSKASASVTVGAGGAQRIDHRAAGGGVAGGIADLGGQRVAAVLLSVTALLQLPLLCTMAVPITVAPSRIVTVAPASADIDRAGDGLARLVGRTAGAGDRNRRRRRVQREAQRGACRCCRRHRSGSPRWCALRRPAARRERPCPLRDWPSPWWRWRLPSMVKCTTVLARPVPLSASIGGDVVGRRRAGVERQRLGHRRGRGAQRIDHRAAGGGVAGGIADLGGQRVAAVAAQRDRAAPAAVALHHGRADRGGAVQDGDGRAGIGRRRPCR